jgi:hypothetical protein
MAIFTIRNILTEDEAKTLNDIRTNGAYDWTRKRKKGEEDYSLTMPKVKKGLTEGLTRKEIATQLQKREGQIQWIEFLMARNYEHPTKSISAQASINLKNIQVLMGRSPIMAKDPDQFKSHDFKRMKAWLTDMEYHALVKEGKAKVA